MRPVRRVAFTGVKMAEVISQYSEQPRAGSRQAADEQVMRLAIETARRGLLAGEVPVGACLVRNGEVLACLNNAVISELDITAHAEMRVIKAACHQLRKLELSGCQLFATVEPCPMCVSACHYARISEIIYGATLDDIHALTGNELIQTVGESVVSSVTARRINGDCLRN